LAPRYPEGVGRQRLDAAEEAEIAPEIDIKVSTETGEIVIADNGPGLPPPIP
jgi:DNA topoisomerase VI subunit B